MDKRKLKKAVGELMLRNRRISGRHQYTVPSTKTYPYQWLWDSCFHAIILSHINYEDAKKELLSLVSKQFPNGLIPHMIYWRKHTESDFPVIEWGKEDTSTITQPPMIAYAVWKIYQQDQDKDFLRNIYPNLNLYYRYLINERDPRNNHLIGIINPDESGEDNSPRFDIPLGLPPVHSLDVNFQKRLELVSEHERCDFEVGKCMRNFFWVKDVPFNAIMVKNLNCLSEIAQVLNFIDDAKYFADQATLISDAMRKLMFEDGLYWSTYDRDYKKVKVKTWAIFMPLFAQICTKSEAQELVQKFLLDETRFGGKFLVPTVSRDEPSFDPDNPWRGIAALLSTNLSWRGPIWIAVNWFIYQGLQNYNFKKEAKMILESSLSLLESAGFRESYNAKTGEGLGAKDFTWGGLILDMDLT
ncbi:hypothetical protein HYT18_03255 [Candidatus Microgenomates bacterium]|nr:hypothetical protein [Candidatus Microgenomates bacterium]